ncbi:MAG TPA: cadherin domain-containing protein [Planctomycetota bacterium]|jgi:hypothetical protein
MLRHVWLVSFFLLAGGQMLANAASRVPENPTGTQAGVVYWFYTTSGSGGVLPNFAQITPSKTGTALNFDLSPRTTDYGISFQYFGYVTVPTTGVYTFYTTSDDGSRLYIGSTLVVENNYSQGMTERSGTIDLMAGTHALTVQWGQGGGGFGLEVRYAGPGVSKQLIPNGALRYLPMAAQPTISGTNSYLTPSTVTLSCSTTGSTIRYTTDGTTPSATNGTTYTTPFVINSACTLSAVGIAPGYMNSVAASAVIAVPRAPENPTGVIQGLIYKFYTTCSGGGTVPDFTTLTPAKTGTITNFLLDPRTTDTTISFQYTGYITIPTSGFWTFYTTSDDGSRLFIGTTLVVENNYAQGMTERSGTIGLAAGTHAITVQWGQGTGGYGLEVRYQGPTGSGVSYQQIPDAVLWYRPLVATPVILPSNNRIPGTNFSMSISCSTPGSTIYYTTTGVDPTTSSAVYSTAVNLSVPVTVKAMATAPNYDPSLVAASTFVTSLPPVNDNFSAAIALSGALPITASGTNLNATWESGEPNHGEGAGQKSIWYTWVAPAAGSYQFSTSGSTLLDTTEMDTTLAVYTGSAVNALTLIAQNDDASSSTATSMVAISAIAGTTYRIAVDGFDGTEGNVTLTISQGPTISVTATTPNASETGPVNGVFTITRTGNTSGDLLVNFAFAGSTTKGADYKRIDEFVTIPNGSASTTVTITPIDDLIIEGSETVTLTLSPSYYYAIDSAHSAAAVIIADNDSGSGTVNDVTWGVYRGFYSLPFDVTISTSTLGASIRYTTDGSMPTPTAGTLYTAAIHITQTTVLRAIAYKTGMTPSKVDTQTYIFTADVINQSPTGAAPAGWPATWGANTVDYGMDPDVVTDAQWSGTIQNDLKTIRTMCLSVNLPDLFDASIGIYANPSGDGYDWERPCSLEMIDPAASANSWGGLCGVRLRGGFSRSTSNPKHAFRFFFRKDYNKGSLSQPLFGPPPAQQKIDKFDLRCDQNYSWSFQGDAGNECFIRDNWSRDTQLTMSGIGTRGDYFHLYINGQYWGLYGTDERPEDSFAANYFGGNSDDYDVIKTSGDTGYNIYATSGNLDAWTRLWKQCKAGLSSNAAYFRILGRNPDGTLNPSLENLLEVDDMIDYMLIMYYGGNLDAPISAFLGNASPNNIFCSRNRKGSAGFRFFAHDSEHTLLNVNENRLGPFSAGDTLLKSNPQWIFQQCMANAEFRMKVADHVRKHFFGSGALTPAACAARFQARMNQLDRAVVGESARWGDSKLSTPATRNDWLNVCNNVLNNFFPTRTQVVLNQLMSANLYPSLSAPTFSQYGGSISPGFTCTVTNPNATGRVYYTVDGADPRAVGGGIAASAVAGSATTTSVVMNGTVTLRTRVLDGSNWSAMTEATFTAPQDFSALKVTEIMYDPPAFNGTDGAEFEFIELKNTGAVALNLSGAQFTSGLGYTFASGSVINPGQFVVLASNPSQFILKYPGVTPYGTYTGRLNNGGDTITLTYSTGTTIFSFNYNNKPPWPATAAGLGFSLVPTNPSAAADYGTATYWRSSTNAGGSPGADDPTDTRGKIFINEALTHVDVPMREYIELYNAGTAAVDISGWYLTDDHTTPLKFRIPDGTVLGAGGYVSFDDAAYNSNPGVPPSFALDSHGEEVYVFSANPTTHALTGYVHGFSFGAAENPVAFGRYVISTGAEHFVAQISNTPGVANSGPRVGPVVFNEVMYQPASSGDPFIELLNITSNPVNLYDTANPANNWTVTGVDYTFPLGAQLPASGMAIVCGMDPATFRTKYSVPAGVPVFGPWATPLSTSGMHLELQKPDHPDGAYVPYIVVDALDYASSAPWPQEPAGNGPSLVRVDPLSYGNDPVNWQKSPANGGSPGRNNAAIPPAPTGVTATAQSNTVINLAWTDNATNETSCTVERSPDGVSNWTALPLLGANVTSYQDRGLSALTTYYYRVHATSPGGDSPASNVAHATTLAPPPPAQPANLVANPFSQTKIDLEWDDGSSNENGFRIERSPDGTNGWTEITRTAADVATYRDNGLQPNTRYYYRVCAFNTYGESNFANIATAQTLRDRILSVRCPAPLVRSHRGTIFIDLNSTGGEHSVTFSVGFDPLVLSNPIATKGVDSGANVTLSQQTGPDGIGVTLTWSGSGAYGSGTKAIASISFDVAGSGSELNTSLSFGDQPLARGTQDANALDLESTYSNGTANVAPDSAPTDLMLSAATLAENLPAGTTVGTFSTTDPDSGETFTYALVSGAGSGDNTAFAISGTALQTAASFDCETKSSYSIRVRTTDVGGLYIEKSFTINVTNINEAPADLTLSSSSIAENQPAGTSVGTFSTSDPDAGDTFTYALVAGTGDNDNASFAVIGATLKTNANFDYESKNSYSIRVRTTDFGGLSLEKSFTISVTNVNEAPTDLALSSSTVQENQPAGTAVGDFSTSDPDAGDSFSYTLVSGGGSADNAAFIITGATLNTAASFDYETKSSYSIRVRSTDAGGLFFEKSFTISVSDVNEAPTDLELSSATIAENQPEGTTVGNFTTTDPDAGDTFTYTLVTGAGDDDNAAFTLNGAALKAGASFDYESKSSYSIRVRTTDVGGLFFEKIFAISITNVNEAPTDLMLSAAAIAENQPVGTGVGDFSTTDPDLGETFTYTMVNGVGADDNAAFSIAGAALQTAASFDYESKSSYSIRVRTSDAGGLFFEKIFTINVIDVNEAPTDLTLSAATVSENQPVGTLVGTLTATDPDRGETFAYALTAGPGDDDNVSFSLSEAALQTAEVFDLEIKNSYSIRVRATDAAGLWFEKSFPITITWVNEAPADLALSGASVPENQPTGTAVGTFSTTDPNVDDTFTYTFANGAGGEDNAAFRIEGTTLKTAASLDYETKNSYGIRVRTTDAGGLFLEKTFTVSVTDVNDAPTDIALSASTLAENQPAGTTVGTFATTDPDAGDTFTYSLVNGAGGQDNALFSIVGDALKTAASFDYEAKSSFGILVRTTDFGGLSFDKSFTIAVTDLNEAPADIALSASAIAENQPAGTIVGTFSTTDPDAGDTFTYSLVNGAGGDDNAAFSISGATLKTAAVFNYEARSSYSIRLRSTDSGGLSFEKSLMISVTNVNEAPSDVALSSTIVMEKQPAGTIVGAFSTTDPDAGDSFTYTLSAAGGVDNASFSIAGSTLKTAASFEFKTKSSYSIRVRTTDAGGLFLEKSFTISVSKRDNAPTDIALSAASLPENQPAAWAVGTFSTTAPYPGETFTYALAVGAGGDDNAAFAISGTTLVSAGSFDHETQSSYAVRVRTTNADGEFFEKSFTIHITNVNEAPTAVATGSPSSGTAPLTVAFNGAGSTDPEGGALTYSWAFGDGAYSTEQNPVHTYAAAGTYSAVVTVTDSGGLTGVAALTTTVSAGTSARPNEVDSDGDGFSDEIEVALQSNPNNAGDTPLGMAAPNVFGELTGAKMNIKLNFRQPTSGDSIKLKCTVPLAAGTVIAGQTVVLDVGGVVKAFTLDKKGASTPPDATASAKLAFKTKKKAVPAQTATLNIRLAKGAFAHALDDDGLANQTQRTLLTVPVTVVFNGQQLKKAVPQKYTAVEDKAGATK